MARQDCKSALTLACHKVPKRSGSIPNPIQAASFWRPSNPYLTSLGVHIELGDRVELVSTSRNPPPSGKKGNVPDAEWVLIAGTLPNPLGAWGANIPRRKVFWLRKWESVCRNKNMGSATAPAPPSVASLVTLVTGRSTPESLFTYH